MGRKVAVALYKANGKTRIRISFAGDMKQLLHSERMQIETKDTLLCFVPEPDGRRSWGAYRPDDCFRVYITRDETVKMLEQFAGEYDRLHKHENGFLYVDLRERMNTPQEPPQESQERPKTASTYKNPYKEPKKETTALLAIVREHRDKAEKIRKDIAEAEKLVKELNVELLTEEMTAKTAEALIKLLNKEEE